MAADFQAGGHLFVFDPEGLIGEGELADLLGHRQFLVHPVHRGAYGGFELRQALQLAAIEFLALRAAPFQLPFGVGHNQADNIGALVPAHHRLPDFGLQGQHSLDLLGRDIVALVIDDHVFLAVGNLDPAFIVDVADIPCMQPAILDRATGFGIILPVPLHHQFAAAEDLPVFGNLYLHAAHWRADCVHRNTRSGTIATDYRAAFGLAVTLQHGQPHRIEENSDFGIERRAARYHCFHTPTETLADFGAQGALQNEIHRPVEQFAVTIGLALPDLQRAVHHVVGRAALLGHLLHNARTEHFEQAGHDHHDGWLSFFNIAGELLQPFRIINLRADADGQKLAARMFVSMAERQEGKKSFVLV